MNFKQRKPELLDASSLILNDDNPRSIKDDKFKKLVASLKTFPDMIEYRPVIVNKDMVIIAGNMRYRAAVELGYKKIPTIVAKDLTEEQEKELIIKDNISYGEWDWDMLANEWDTDELTEWGLDVWKKPEDIDYSILDEVDLSGDISDMTKNIKKAIQIEFEMEHFEEAQELVKYWREQGLYIGGFLMEKLKEEKEKNV
jgi:hypothetical protein